MKRDELFASIEAARPGRDDIVYVERRADEYNWRIVPTGSGISEVLTSAKPEPDVWMSLSAEWPTDTEQLQAFFDDLLAELESMSTHADRCRWPADEPWPHFH